MLDGDSGESPTRLRVSTVATVGAPTLFRKPEVDITITLHLRVRVLELQRRFPTDMSTVARAPADGTSKRGTLLWQHRRTTWP